MSDGVRSFVARPGVGVTANVIQHSELRFSRIVVQHPALIAMRHGEKTLEAGTRRWTVSGGELLAIAGGQSFDVTNRLSSNGLYEARWLVWDPGLLAPPASIPSRARPVSGAVALRSVDAELRAAIDRAVDAVHDIPAVPDEVARHRLAEPLVWLALRGIWFTPPRTATVSMRLRALIAETAAAPWKVPEVAQRLAMSEATLRRRLAAEGTTFAALLADIRMSRAMTLLQSTDHPVARIATDVGYESASRFALRFRARFGFAPTAIRGHQRRPD